MAQQSEARDIGQRVNARESGQPHAGSIELRRAGDQFPILSVGDLLLLERGAVDADAERLAEDDRVARLRLRVALDAARIDQADGDQAVDRLHRIDAVAAGDGNAGSLADRFAAVEDSAHRLERQLVDRHRHQRQREERTPAHGVDIRDGVGRGDRAEVERIVDDRHEEIGRRDDRLILADLIDRRVVARLDADQQLARDETCRVQPWR